jgi:hypothetical protein
VQVDLVLSTTLATPMPRMQGTDHPPGLSTRSCDIPSNYALAAARVSDPTRRGQVTRVRRGRSR